MASMRDDLIVFKRERILNAAVELFYQRGYQNTTLDAVASELGVRKPFIYSYYRSKSDLLAAICERGIQSSLAVLRKVMELDLPATERVRQLGREFVLVVLGAQKHIAIYSREEKNLLPEDFKRISAMRREFDHKLTALLEEGRASGEFEIDDCQIAALAIGGMVSWIYVWYRPEGRLDAETIADLLSDFILRMIAVRPNGTEPIRS